MATPDCFATYGLEAVIRFAASIGVAAGCERSVRLSHRCLERRRALISFVAEDVLTSSPDALSDLCDAMRAPQTTQSRVRQFAGAAEFIHFGFERSGETHIGKCYLELPAAPMSHTLDGRVQFVGFKWSMSAPGLAVATRYRVVSCETWDDVSARLLPHPMNFAHEPLRDLLERVRPTADAADLELCLLEVDEEGSDRRSWDLKIADCSLALSALADPVRALSAALQIPAADVDALMQSLSDAPVGHLATGTGREGSPFLTIYHSAGPLGPSFCSDIRA